MAVEVLGAVKNVKNYQYLTSEQAFAITGNSGNLAFYESLRSYLTSFTDALFDHPGDQNSVGIIPCSNFIGSHANNKSRAKFCKNYKGNLVAIGLGAQADLGEGQVDLGAGTETFLKELTSKAHDGPNITVRGHHTKKILDELGYGNFAEVLGCPSLFLNPDRNLGKQLAKNSKGSFTKFAASAGSPLNESKYQSLEIKLAQMVSQKKGAYVVQHPLHFVQLARGDLESNRLSLFKKYNQVLCPDLNAAQFRKWCKRNLQCFFNLDAWINFLQSYDVMVGTRIHGTMLALQAGTPAVCIVHDSRTEELCQIMHIPYIYLADLDFNSIEEAVVEKVQSYDWQAFDDNREVLRHRFGEFLTRNKISHKL